MVLIHFERQPSLIGWPSHAGQMLVGVALLALIGNRS